MAHLNRRQFWTWAAGTVAASTGIAGLINLATREEPSDFERALQDYKHRYYYIPEKFGSKKPENVEKIVYDHSRTGATSAEARYAQLAADQYHQNFDNPEALQEVKNLLRGYFLFDSGNEEEVSNVIANFTASKNGRLVLRDIIEAQLKSKTLQEIKSSSAIAIEIPQEYGKAPRFNVFVFPGAFESRQGEVKQTESGLNAIVEVQYLVAQGKYKIPTVR